MDFHPSEDISSSAVGSIQTILICMANPQLALPQIDQGKFNTDYIKSGQGFWLMVEANFPGTRIIRKRWTLPETCIVVFPGINSILFLLLLNTAFYWPLKVPQIVDSIYNELLLILPPLVFFGKQLLGSFLVFIIHLLYNQSDVLVRSGQILHHQYDIFAVVPQTPIPRKTTVVVVLRILDCFLSYKKIENCKLLFCCLLYFLGHLAGCSSSCGRRTWMERWPVLSQSTRIIWYWQATPLKRVQGNRSPNKSHIGQEMARKFGLLCLVQVSNFFSTSGKNLWIKYSFARSIKDQK